MDLSQCCNAPIVETQYGSLYFTNCFDCGEPTDAEVCEGCGEHEQEGQDHSNCTLEGIADRYVL